MLQLKIKRLTETAKMPTRGSEKAAGLDLYADMDNSLVVLPHRTYKIKTGLAMEIPDGYFGAIFARSGLAIKQGTGLANAVAVIDGDFRGEVIVALHNHTTNSTVIMPHERIAQMILIPYPEVEIEEVDELSDTERGTGGFGSTGKL